MSELRAAVPALDERASDEHFKRIIKAEGDISLRQMAAEIFCDAAQGHRITPETLMWYRSHGSRQKKARKRGRPRKKNH